jgi:hypothetical protein
VLFVFRHLAPLHDNLRPAIKSGGHQNGDLLWHLSVAKKAPQRDPARLLQFGPRARARGLQVGDEECGDLAGKGMVRSAFLAKLNLASPA